MMKQRKTNLCFEFEHNGSNSIKWSEYNNLKLSIVVISIVVRSLATYAVASLETWIFDNAWYLCHSSPKVCCTFNLGAVCLCQSLSQSLSCCSHQWYVCVCVHISRHNSFHQAIEMPCVILVAISSWLASSPSIAANCCCCRCWCCWCCCYYYCSRQQNNVATTLLCSLATTFVTEWEEKTLQI